jgi:O-antigen/teichoic acid export membrane protein
MWEKLRERSIRLLRWSEKYTKTDMVYLVTTGFWFNLGTVLISLFSLALYVVFARFVPKEVYGTYQYLLSIAAIASTFTLTGMNSAVSQAVTRGYEGTLKASIRVQLLWNLVPAAGALIGAIYYFAAGNVLLAAGFVLIAIATPVVNAYNTYNALLVGKKDFRRSFFYSLALNVPYYGLLMLVAVAWPYVIALLLANLFINTGMAVVLYRRTLAVEQPNDAVDESAFSYGKHLTAINALSSIAGQIDNILVFHYLGPLELAIYSFATAVPDRLAGFFRFFGSVAFPKFVTKSEDEIRATIGPKLLHVTVLGFIAAALYALCAPLFFHIFFPQYGASVLYSQLYALSMAGVAGNIALSALISQRRTRDLYLLNIALPLIQVVLLVAGLLWWGLWGLIVGKIASSVLSAAFTAALLLFRRTAPAR